MQIPSESNQISLADAAKMLNVGRKKKSPTITLGFKSPGSLQWPFRRLSHH